MNCANHSDIAAVAFCRTCGKPLCQTCTRDVRGVIYCESCLAARLDGTAPAAGFVPPAQTVYPPGGPAYVRPGAASSGPNPTVAGILGAIPFGVGAVYCGQYVKGLVYMGIAVLTIVLHSQDISGIAHAALGIFQGFFWIYQIIDSVRTARAIQMGEPAPDPLGLVAMFGGNTGAPGTSTAGGVAPRSEPAKIPIAAAVLIGLGVLFLINTAFDIGLHRYWSLILIALGVYLFAKQWGLLATYQPACVCERCRTRKLLGPALLVTIGVMFLLHSVSEIGIGRTWPAILLVIGVVKLMQSNASYNGHVGPLPPGSPGFPPQGPPPMSPATPQDGVQTTEQTSSGEVKNV
jgi:B-box zinc finger